MADYFPFLPSGEAPAFSHVDGGSFWFLLKGNHQEFSLQRTWGDLDDIQRGKLIDEALFSERCHHAFKLCCESNNLQRIDQTFMIEGFCCHCDIELVPVIKDVSIDIIGHMQLLGVNPLHGLDKAPDLQSVLLPLFHNVNQRIAQTIKSLKTSVYLLNKADKVTTRCYFNELADANISKIECLVDDVSLFHNLIRDDNVPVLTQFSLSAIIEDIQISRQGLLSQRNITLAIDMGNLPNHYVIGDGDYFMMLLNKLFDLVISWNDRGTVRIAGQIEKMGSEDYQLHLNFYSHCLRLPVGVEVSDVNNLLCMSKKDPQKMNVLPLLDMLICRQILKNLKGKISVSQVAAMDMNIKLGIPIHIQP